LYLTLYEYLEEIGYENRLVSAEAIVSALRQRKSRAEIDCIRQAIAHTQEIFADVTAVIRPSTTERKIARYMKEQVAEAGLELAWEQTVCPAVFTGPEHAGAHYAPTDRPVEPGHVVNIDFGVKYNGYCSDMQRTFYVRRDAQDAYPEVHAGFDTIVAAIEAARRAMRPGVPGLDVDRAAREIVVSNGYDEFPHGLGHQIGRFAHDGTALLGPAWEKYATKPYQPLEENMVFTLEPRLTVPGAGVVTIEEIVIVTQSGAEYLSTPQSELIAIEPIT